jgi:hypothetical protein
MSAPTVIALGEAMVEFNQAGLIRRSPPRRDLDRK